MMCYNYIKHGLVLVNSLSKYYTQIVPTVFREYYQINFQFKDNIIAIRFIFKYIINICRQKIYF